MAQSAKKPATYADIEALPHNMVGQLIDGELYAHARPATRHARAISRLHGWLDRSYDLERNDGGGPGGWIFLFEPELHFRQNVLVPDLAGWTRERMPELPDAAFLTLAPDWICEGLSPSTASVDKGPKLKVYAREHVPFVWFVDPDAKLVEVFRLNGDRYELASTHADDERARATPFEAAELPLVELWSLTGRR